MPLLNTSRRVVAPDYPGYGGSALLSEPPTINDYAKAMLETIDAISDSPVAVFGFHTGCLVAIEMALIAPAAMQNVVLCDVPYFTADVRAGLREKFAQPLPVTPKLDSLQAAWEFNITSRVDSVSLERALALFVEHLRGGTHDYYAFDAAFRYDCEARFAKLKKDTRIIATQSGLLEPSRAAARELANAQLTEALEIKTAVFESSAAAIAKRILTALDNDHD